MKPWASSDDISGIIQYPMSYIFWSGNSSISAKNIEDKIIPQVTERGKFALSNFILVSPLLQHWWLTCDRVINALSFFCSHKIHIIILSDSHQNIAHVITSTSTIPAHRLCHIWSRSHQGLVSPHSNIFMMMMMIQYIAKVATQKKFSAEGAQPLYIPIPQWDPLSIPPLTKGAGSYLAGMAVAIPILNVDGRRHTNNFSKNI